MTPVSRERTLLRTFATLADTLVDDFDVLDMLQVLVDNCLAALDIDAAGILLADRNGQLELAASTSEANRVVEMMQLGAESGPCITSFRTGEVVLVSDIADGPPEWAGFTSAASAQGYNAVFAIPMRLRSETIGSLNLMRSRTGELSEDDVAAAQALADVAAIGILQERALRESDAVVRQLEGALNSRVIIEQAKGVIAHTRSVSVDEAFAILRAHARANRMSVSAVATAIVERRLVI